MADSYLVINGARQTTAAPVAVTTGTAIKTLLQISTAATRPARVIEWGISFDASAAATPIKVELIETDVAATVTAYVAADVTKYSDPNAPASLATLGVANSGYTATAEGTIAAVRVFDVQFIAPTSQYFKQFPLGREPEVAVSTFLRVRVTAGTATNSYAYVIWEE